MGVDRILIVEDDTSVRTGLRTYFAGRGYAVLEAGTVRDAQELLARSRPDLALIDYQLPDGNGVELVRTIAATDARVPSIILTGHGSIDLAVRAIKEGAEQFVTKPIELGALQILVERLIEQQRHLKKAVAHTAREERDEVWPFVGDSPAVRRFAQEARRLLGSESPILIHGETGSGKGLLARWLHQHGPRRREAFVDLNCAGLARDLLESELFGHDKGAFTGAVSAKPGLLEVAHRGSLFLDEIGDLDEAVQPKLLKVLEEKRFRRLGEVRDREVSVRLISASHRRLSDLVAAGSFRRDLYYRISTLPITVPSLRERREDLPELARDILRRLAADLGRPAVELAPDATDALCAYSFPGNVRELRNVLERAVLISGTDRIRRADLAFLGGRDEPAGLPTGDLTLQELERRQIEHVYLEEACNVERTARRLGIPRSSLYQKLRRLGLSTPRR